MSNDDLYRRTEPIARNFINTTKDTESKYNEILKDLQNADSNLELKTEVIKPINLAIFNTAGNILKEKDFPLTADFIHSYITVYLKYMISNKRLSRKEIISAIISLNQQEKEQMSGLSLFSKNLKQ